MFNAYEIFGGKETKNSATSKSIHSRDARCLAGRTNVDSRLQSIVDGRGYAASWQTMSDPGS